MQPFHHSNTPYSALHLPEQWHLVYLPQTDSTMLQLKRAEYAPNANEFVLMVTDFQAAGRVHRGRLMQATTCYLALLSPPNTLKLPNNLPSPRLWHWQCAKLSVLLPKGLR